MARRRGRKGRRRAGKGAIPVPLAVVAILPAIKAWKDGAGDAQAVGRNIVYEYTGYNATSGQWVGSKVYPLLGGVIAATVAHKIASKTGINSKLKKLTMGYFQL